VARGHPVDRNLGAEKVIEVILRIFHLRSWSNKDCTVASVSKHIYYAKTKSKRRIDVFPCRIIRVRQPSQDIIELCSLYLDIAEEFGVQRILHAPEGIPRRQTDL